MKKQLGLLVAIFGLAILTSCGGGEATEQVQQGQVQEQVEQVQQVAPAMDSTAMDSTAAE